MAPRSPFATITTEGGLLSSDLLARLARQPNSLSGTSPDDYHLVSGRRLRDAINRSWTELQGAWTTFATELAKLPAGERATTVTRERWLLPLFAELGFGRLQRASAITVAGREYPISHLWGAVPIHLLGTDVELDRRTKGVAGAATAAPSSMVQELLNRSEDHLWAILSNGRRLRLLRDNTSLTRASYVEFDLEAMFADQVFTDFAVLWMVCHESRFEAEQPEQCWLERWIGEARQQGVRALDTLRTGFEKAITSLGSGFLAQPGNAELRERLRDGKLSVEDYHRQVLRLVYRLVFLLVAEDRDLFHPPATSDQARQHYARYYSLGRIRDHARRHRGTRHSDLFESLAPVFVALGANGIAKIGVPALGSFLWSPDACPDLDGAALSNNDLLKAVRHLAYTEQDRALQRVDFANLGPEELGSVYESLLELHPRLEIAAARFELFAVAGSERKSTGSYYTPTSLIATLLDQALDPLLNEAEAAPDPIQAILSIKVLDPACGSGHFLTAAARRIANRLAALQTGELNPTPEAARHALRQVVGRCVYGIDLNPMAAELAKVNLWLDAVEPGLPLRFLDHHIVCGNGLVGTNPRLVADGIPDEAFKPIEGDDKAIAAVRKKTNAAERRQRNQGLLALGDSALAAAEQLAKSVELLDAEDDTTAEGLRRKQQHWQELLSSDDARLAKLVADTWCAAFLSPKTPGSPAITDQTLRAVAADRIDNPDAIALVVDLSNRYRFLHPHLAFPEVFTPDSASEDGWRGGFDLVLGNPPFVNAIEGGVAAALKQFLRFTHDNIGGTADLSYYFLSGALKLVHDNGRVALVQPRAVLNSPAARILRGNLPPTLRPNLIYAPNRSDLFVGPAVFVALIALGPDPECWVSRDDDPATAQWSHGLIESDNWWSAIGQLLEDGKGVAEHWSGPIVADTFSVAASMTTGDAYDVVPLVVDEPDRPFPKLVTTGLIEPGFCLWGKATCRYLKRDYTCPRIRPSSEMTKSLLRRLDNSRRPKILVAGLSKQIECFVDREGEYIGAVSTFSIFHPNDDIDELDSLCSYLLSDYATHRFVQELGGNAMGGGSTTMKKSFLAALPLNHRGAY